MELSKLEQQSLAVLEHRQSLYEKQVQKALADALLSIRGELSRLYDKYSVKGLLTRAEMTKYNKYSTMETQMLKLINPAIAANIKTIKYMLPEQYNASFFNYAWAMDNGNGVRLAWGIVDTKAVQATFDITNPKNIELKEALHNYGPSAKKYIRNALLKNLSRGKGYTEMVNDIKAALNKTAYEALRILRTEGQRAISRGQDDAYLRAREKGIEGDIIWDATKDIRTRASHGRADGTIKSADGLFHTKDFIAEYPLDPNLPAEESINCRCRERFQVTGYSPQLMRTREEGVIPYQTFSEYVKEWHPEWLKK